jgi:hypothetical protein
MTCQEFIERLKTFPPTNTARAYCPVDKTYYYFIVYLIPLPSIELTKIRNHGTYSGLIYFIESNQEHFQRDIIFTYHGQKFTIL